MSKGILLSLLTLFLLLNLIALNQIAVQSDSSASESIAGISALTAASDKLELVAENIVFLHRFGAAESIAERALPFSFSLDSNRFEARQRLPVNADTLNGFFDSINSFRVFVSDTNYSNAFDGLAVDANTIENDSWNGNSERISFLVKPQCLEFFVKDLNLAGFNAGNCESAFDINSVKRFDLNVLVPSTEDFNSVQCSFDGSIGCPSAEFTPGAQGNFVEINLLDENCSNCSIPAGQKKISAYYIASADNNVTISCTGICNSEPVVISVGKGLTVESSGNRIEFVFSALFDSPVKQFKFNDFNVSVSNKNAGVSARYGNG